MAKKQTPQEKAIERLIAFFDDNQILTADALGVKQPSVSGWVTGRSKPGAKTCIRAEEKTGGAVTRYELRPDIFGAAPPRSAAA